jgi:hypothetical protein
MSDTRNIIRSNPRWTRYPQSIRDVRTVAALRPIARRPQFTRPMACSCPTFSADYGFPGRHRRHTGPCWTRNAAVAAGQPRQHAAFDSNPVDNLRGIEESECGSRGQSRFSKGST